MTPPEESKIGFDVNENFNACLESLENAAKQMLKLRNRAERMDDLLRQLVSISKMKSRAFIGETFVDRLSILQRVSQADFYFRKHFSHFSISGWKRECNTVHSRGYGDIPHLTLSFRRVTGIFLIIISFLPLDILWELQVFAGGVQ